MKRVLKMDRLRLRGLKGARDEFLLTATAQNLRRMAKYLGTGPSEIRRKQQPKQQKPALVGVQTSL